MKQLHARERQGVIYTFLRDDMMIFYTKAFYITIQMAYLLEMTAAVFAAESTAGMLSVSPSFTTN